MTRRTLDQAHTAREVCAALDHHPALLDVRQSGSHRVYRGPTGTVIVANHNGDVPRGTLRSITRMAQMAGLLMLIAGMSGALLLAVIVHSAVTLI